MTPPHDDAVRASFEQARATLDAFLADPDLIHPGIMLVLPAA